MADSDESLYTSWAGGDRAAGGRLVDRHLDAIRRFFASKTFDDIDPDELAARVFSSCADQLGRFRGEASFRSYLFGIAYNTLREALRGRRAREPFDPESSALADLGPSPASVVSLERHRQTLVLALRTLPMHYQVALELAYFEDLSRSEIAAVLGIPAGTVASRVRRGLAELEKRVRELDADPVARKRTLADLGGWSDGPDEPPE